MAMAALEENKLPPSFSAFKSQNFLYESSRHEVSGTDNDEQSLKNLSECLPFLAARSVLSSTVSCKRRALIIKDEFKNTYFS